MIRTQIQLTEEQSKQLKALARQEGISIAELIRRSVDEYMRNQPMVSLEERKRWALSITGKYASGRADIAEEHDRYLAAAFGEAEG